MRKMKTIFLIGPTIVFLLVLPRAALSIPVNWTSPQWNVELRGKSIAGNASAQRAFGLSAINDGDIVDVTANTAVAKAEARVDAWVWTASAAQTSVWFSRDFSLSGSPEGTNITVYGTLAGRLFASGSSNPWAAIQAHGQILNTSINVWWSDAEWDDDRSFSIFKHESGVLMDGTYTVEGEILTTASIGTGLFGGAISNFFSSLQIGVVPEPATVLLVGLGSLALLRKHRI